MDLSRATAIVTGANRGLGAEIIHALRKAGVAKIYAGMRNPVDPGLDGVVPLRLDVTDQEQIDAAAAKCADVTLLVNNAGVAFFLPLIAANNLDAARLEMETNYFGMLRLCRAFAPILGRNGGGAIANILSTSSWVNTGFLGSYAASKAAQWSLTMGIRIELRGQGTLVAGLHCGYLDTDMATSVVGRKSKPSDVAAALVEGLRHDREEILADARAADLKARLNDLRSIEARLQAAWDENAARAF